MRHVGSQVSVVGHWLEKLGSERGTCPGQTCSRKRRQRFNERNVLLWIHSDLVKHASGSSGRGATFVVQTLIVDDARVQR